MRNKAPVRPCVAFYLKCGEVIPFLSVNAKQGHFCGFLLFEDKLQLFGAVAHNPGLLSGGKQSVWLSASTQSGKEEIIKCRAVARTHYLQKE